MTPHIQRALKTYAAAWTSGDLAAITQCYHDDFTLHYFGRNGLSGDHAGKARALRVLGEFSRRTRRRLLAIIATMAGEARGSIIAREQLHRGEDRHHSAQTSKATCQRVPGPSFRPSFRS